MFTQTTDLVARTTSMLIEASRSATSRELCRALDALQFQISVKGR